MNVNVYPRSWLDTYREVVRESARTYREVYLVK